MQMFQIMDRCWGQVDQEKSSYDDLENLYSLFNVEPQNTNNRSRYEVTEFIRHSLIELLEQHSSNKIMEVIRVLKADLFYYYITENYDIGIKLSILEFIRECVKITEDKKREMPVNSSSCKTFINDICLRTCQYLVLTNYGLATIN